MKPFGYTPKELIRLYTGERKDMDNTNMKYTEQSRAQRLLEWCKHSLPDMIVSKLIIIVIVAVVDLVDKDPELIRALLSLITD